MRDTKSILLLLVSICLIGSWMFHVYDKSKYAVVAPKQEHTNANGKHRAFIDSLEERYQTEKQALEQLRNGNDSLTRELQQKWRQLDSLRAQIDRMTAMPPSPLFTTPSSVPKGQVSNKPEGATSQIQTANKINTPEQPGSGLKPPSKAPSNSVQGPSGWNASDFQMSSRHLSAPLQLSFQIYQNAYSVEDAQLYVVVKDPSGSVLQEDQWSAGVFASQKEGVLKYSRRIQVDYVRGERKRLQVEVPSATVQKGKYQVWVYHNGLPIGNSSLSIP